MKTIKIFFASSEELEDDRNAFGNLIRRLSKAYEMRGVKLELFEWEDYDAAYNNCRKQDEYNEQVRASDIFLAAFYKKAGKFTIEEFNVAVEEFKKKKSPKVYVFCKDLKDGESENVLLKEFKERLINDMGHYWCRYSNRDTLNLNFVLQLLLVEGNSEVRVDDGKILLEDEPIACLDKLPFASQNEDFQKANTRLEELQLKIEKMRSKIIKYPDDNDFESDLQSLLDEYNKQKEDFAKYQSYLLDTARRIANQQGKAISSRLHRAITAFHNGKIQEANIILEESEKDGDIVFQAYKHDKELAMQIETQNRENVIKSISEILFKASVLRTDFSIPAKERVTKIIDLYTKTDNWAQEIGLEIDSYEQLLAEYASSLYDFGKYREAISVLLRLLNLCQDNSEKKVTIYNYLGLNHSNLSNYTAALEFYNQSLSICKEIYGEESLKIASLYKSISSIYCDLSAYDKALDLYQNALAIQKKVLGECEYTAMTYFAIAQVFAVIDEPQQASEYASKACAIAEDKIFNEYGNIRTDKIELACTLYGAAADILCQLGDYEEARELYNICLELSEENNGPKHPNTAFYYKKIGWCQQHICFDDTALRYYIKSSEILEYSLGSAHPDTIQSYIEIGEQYMCLGDRNEEYSRIKDHEPDNYRKALCYYEKALRIQKTVFGEVSSDVAMLHIHIGDVYKTLGDRNSENVYLAKVLPITGDIYERSVPINYEKSLELYKKALEIQESVYGKEHLDIAVACFSIGEIYFNLCQYDKAHDFYDRALEIRKKLLGSEHFVTIETKEKWGEVNSIINTTKDDKNTPWFYYVLAILIFPVALPFWIYLFWKKNYKKHYLKHQIK